MSTRPTCGRCGHIHCASDVVALGRFDAVNGVSGYMARHDFAPLRRTRAEADEDACLYRRLRRTEVEP